MPENNIPASGIPGSVISEGPALNPNALGGAVGQPQVGNVDYKELYEGLERKLGSQGKELGEYRTFFEGISPLLSVLDKSPELVQAILDGKIDQNLVQAINDGKISAAEAQIATQAHDDVKKELGKKEYNASSTDEIAKLVDGKMEEMRREIKKMDEERAFEASVSEFIANTPDFQEYAGAIGEWLDEHDVTDIKVAYYAVKGQMSERSAKKLADEHAAEIAKNMALNAGGGAGNSTFIHDNPNFVDSLIAGKSNPNVF